MAWFPTLDLSLSVNACSFTSISGITPSLKVSTVTTGRFTALTTLSTGALPAGVTATFNPISLGPNASGLLTLTTSGSSPSSSSIEVRGTAITRTATATLNVQAAGQTVLTGQVLDENEKPIPGVSIKLGGSTITTLGTTDAAGNFLINPAVAGPQVFLIDGSTANTPTVSYATIPVTVTIQAGMVNTLGFTPHLHAQPTTQALPVAPSVATPITFASVPDFQVTIPAGVQIIGWDEQPNTQIGVRPVPLDRLAVPPPPSGVETNVVYMFSFGKVGGGTPTPPIPVTLPNTIGAYPGQQVELWFFNEAPDGTAPNAWQMFGFGTVSNDGKLIVSNPGVGIPRFCCGATLPRRPQPPPDTPQRESAPEPSPEDCPTCGGPIDLASGIVWYSATDLSLKGRMPISVTRQYRTLDPTIGPFGVGGRHQYEVFLRAVTNDLVLLLTPKTLRPRFLRQPDGTYVNPDYPDYRGAVLTRNPDGTTTLRYKDGTLWTFNLAGWLVRQRDRTGNIVHIFRDAQNRVTSIVEPAGRELTFTYGGSDPKVQQVTDPLGRTVRYEYNASHQLTKVTDPLGGAWQYTYDAGGRLATITDPRGIVIEQNTYDSAGRVTQQIQADGGAFQISYKLVAGTIASVTMTDPNGHRTTYRLTGGKFLSTTTDALGQGITVNRTPGSNLVQSRTDALGRETRYTYDTSGNLTSLTDATGATAQFAYEPVFGRLLRQTDPAGQSMEFTYDPQGNLTQIRDRLGNLTSLGYDALGQPIQITDALGRTSTHTYDALGNLTVTTDVLGNRTERSYDAISRLVTVKDAVGTTTHFEYDLLDRVTAVRDALGNVTRFGYDPVGNVVSVTDARGNVFQFAYDGRNRLIQQTDPLGRTSTATYDGNGNLVGTTDRKGQLTTHTYDAQNRRLRSLFADGSTLEYAYDPLGQLRSLTDSLTGPIQFTYDLLGRLIQEDTPQGSVAYAYDLLGRRQQMQVGGGIPVTYAYDAQGRLTQVHRAGQTATIAYDALGRRTQLTLPNGVTVASAYDGGSRLSQLTYTGPGGPLGELTYGYDALGRRTLAGGSLARTSLPAAVAVTSHNAANQVLSFGDRGLTYDPNGNLLTQTDPTGTITYTWDARDRLSSLAGPAVTASFSYDALDRRVSRTVNGETMTFQYDGLDIVRESGPDGETGYLRTGALDEIVAQFAGPEMRVPMTDALGSTLAVLDAAGSPVTTYTYEPYGRVTTTNPTPRFPFRFTGREDDGTGLYYFRARYYDPVLSRFISEDPIGLLGGFNVYAYAGGDPVNWIDPLGLKMSRKTYVELCDFVRKYYTDAAEAGQNAPLPAEFILALSAHESKRGKSDAARDARGNFFGQTKPGGGLMTQGGFRNGADYFVKNWRNQYARGGQPPETIRDFVTNLTSDPSKMYNELGKDGQGDPEWREKVTDRYNEVVEVLKDPCCDPESQKGGP